MMFEIETLEGQRFNIRLPDAIKPAPFPRSSVFGGDDCRLLGYVDHRFEARNCQGASLGVFETTSDAISALLRLLEWKPAV